MNEILQVQGQINDIQEDIEAANGRINYLQHASAYSTINLNYYQYLNGSTADNEKPDFLTKLSRAFSTGTEVISGFTLFCISIWPVILLGLFICIYLKRLKLKKPVKTYIKKHCKHSAFLLKKYSIVTQQNHPVRLHSSLLPLFRL
jgi:hypothetical protein